MKKKKMLWIGCIFLGVLGCSRGVPLDKDEFVELLIDVHMADATLALSQEYRGDERQTYMYYNDVFEKHGVSKVEFDSCVRYYATRPTLFAKMYAAVIDTLNRRLTAKTRVWNVLTVNDTVNLFPGYRMQVFDTLSCDSVVCKDEFIALLDAGIWEHKLVNSDTVYLDERNPWVEIEMDGIEPGMYKFSTVLQFDHRDKGKRNCIRSYFLSDQNDTLKVRNIWVSSDSTRRTYSWMHYVADSIYKKLEIRLVDCANLKEVRGKRSGKIWETKILKTYVSEKQAKRYKEQYKSHQ